MASRASVDSSSASTLERPAGFWKRPAAAMDPDEEPEVLESYEPEVLDWEDDEQTHFLEILDKIGLPLSPPPNPPREEFLAILGPRHGRRP